MPRAKQQKPITRKTKEQHSHKNRSLLLGLLGAGIAISFVCAKLLVHFLQSPFKPALAAGVLVALVCCAIGALILWRRQQMGLFFKGFTLLAAIGCFTFFLLGAVSLTQGRLLEKTKGISITYDEVSILPNGYFAQKTGTNYINPEHPPLVKDVAALPFRLLGVHLPKDELPRDILLQDYAQYYWGKTFLFESGNPTERIVFFARVTVLFTNALLLFGLYLALAKLWSKRAAFIGLFFMLTAPFNLAHASLVTVDFMTAVLSLLSVTWFALFLRRFREKKPVTSAAIGSAALLAAALVAKFSAILLVPILMVSAVIYAAVDRRTIRGRLKSYALMIFFVFSLALVLVTVFYSWHVRNMTTGDLIEQLRYNFTKDNLPAWIHSFVESVARGGYLGRGLAEFMLGLIKINTRIYKGAGGVYFMGNFYGAEGAGPLYFPVLYLAKMQIAYHIATLVAVVGGCIALMRTKGKRITAYTRQDPGVLVIVLYCLAFAAIAIASTLQIGLRHVLPVILGIMVLVGLGIDLLLRSKFVKTKQRSVNIVIGVGIIWLLVSMLSAYPFFLSNYNRLAGGTNNGHKIAVDSNYDWGQDIKYLATWQKQHNVSEINVDLFANPFLPLEYYLGDGVKSYKVGVDKPLPKGSYLAVSANQYEINRGRHLSADKSYTQFDRFQVARVGKTIFIYKIPD